MCGIFCFSGDSALEANFHIPHIFHFSFGAENLPLSTGPSIFGRARAHFGLFTADNGRRRQFEECGDFPLNYGSWLVGWLVGRLVYWYGWFATCHRADHTSRWCPTGRTWISSQPTCPYKDVRSAIMGGHDVMEGV